MSAEQVPPPRLVIPLETLPDGFGVCSAEGVLLTAGQIRWAMEREPLRPDVSFVQFREGWRIEFTSKGMVAHPPATSSRGPVTIVPAVPFFPKEAKVTKKPKRRHRRKRYSAAVVRRALSRAVSGWSLAALGQVSLTLAGALSGHGFRSVFPALGALVSVALAVDLARERRVVFNPSEVDRLRQQGDRL